MRGENVHDHVKQHIDCGTSPRARGKLLIVGGLDKDELEHPRVRGENHCSGLLGHNISGTSPRARGKRLAFPDYKGPVRNIPACAGKTGTNEEDEEQSAEHPRVRGENWADVANQRGIDGTSPRARGKLERLIRAGVSYRNIPACAGKTSPK